MPRISVKLINYPKLGFLRILSSKKGGFSGRFLGNDTKVHILSSRTKIDHEATCLEKKTTALKSIAIRLTSLGIMGAQLKPPP